MYGRAEILKQSRTIFAHAIDFLLYKTYNFLQQNILFLKLYMAQNSKILLFFVSRHCF